MHPCHNDLVSKDPKLIKHHLKVHQSARIIAHCQQLESLNQLVLQMLPQPLAKQSKVMNLDGSTLVIGVSNANWLQRAQFSEAQLKQQLQFHPETKTIELIKWKILPTEKKPAQLNKKNSRKLTDTGKDHLQRLSEITKSDKN